MSSPLVRVAFVVLLLATVGAFIATQQLKSEFPLVLRFSASPDAISPNGDKVRDVTNLGFDLSEDARVTFSVLDADGNEVRRLVDDRLMEGDVRHRFRWNGRDGDGRIVPEGTYRMRIVRRDEGRVINSFKDIRVDVTPPPVRLVSARPGVIAPADRRARVVIRYRGPENDSPEFRIFRTDDGPPRVVTRFRGDETKRAVWRGTLRGRVANDGAYAFTVRVRDRAGNETTAPREIPTAAAARPGTGVAVRHLTLSGPLVAVRPGSAARMSVGPFRRRFQFALSRLGARRVEDRGRRRGGSFRVRVPRSARSGLYVVRVRAGGRRAMWPLVVNRPGPPRPLVVLPAISWQGENRVDDDLDGFSDTLSEGGPLTGRPRGRRVRAGRHFARGRLPRGLRAESAPLLRFLDRNRLRYHLTTDLALARREGPKLADASGVVVAGSARWLPPRLQAELRRYVGGGGRLASFGADAFRRGVQVRRGSLARPGAPRPVNAFGERTEDPRRALPAPLVAQEDEAGLFDAPARVVGSFSIFEPSEGPPAGAGVLATAGRDPGVPAFVAYRLGRGLVIRSGTPQWAREAAGGGAGVAIVTRRIWRLIARG